MKAKELNLKLLKEFPILKEKFNEYTSWQDGIDTGSHIIYEDIFVPYIVKVVLNYNEIETKKCFKYIETILNLNDSYSKNVIIVSVLEPLKYNYSKINFKDYLLEVSKKYFDEIVC